MAQKKNNCRTYEIGNCGGESLMVEADKVILKDGFFIFYKDGVIPLDVLVYAVPSDTIEYITIV